MSLIVCGFSTKFCSFCPFRELHHKNKSWSCFLLGCLCEPNQPFEAELERKTSTNGQSAARGDIVMSHTAAFEKLDLELITREKMQKEVSFADQIRAVKNKRMELTMEASSSVHAANKKPGEYA